MKKQILFAGLILFSIVSTQNSALSYDGWYKKYDHDKDGRWNYDEFARAQREWQIAHHERVMSDREMRELYDRHDKDKDGFWAAEEARHAHHW